MRRMSFALTQEQILDKSKTVTRRLGWGHLMPGDIIQPVQKCMGLKKGEKQKLLGNPIEVVSISMQPLHQITQEDVVREGFLSWDREQFIMMFCMENKCWIDQSITRIEFKYL